MTLMFYSNTWVWCTCLHHKPTPHWGSERWRRWLGEAWQNSHQTLTQSSFHSAEWTSDRSETLKHSCTLWERERENNQSERPKWYQTNTRRIKQTNQKTLVDTILSIKLFEKCSQNENFVKMFHSLWSLIWWIRNYYFFTIDCTFHTFIITLT